MPRDVNNSDFFPENLKNASSCKKLCLTSLVPGIRNPDLCPMELVTLHDRQFKPYLSEGAIRTRVLELSHQLSQEVSSPNTLAVPVLQGAYLFAADLLREVAFRPKLHFIRVSSYLGGLETTGELHWLLDLPEDLSGREVLLMEDIVDSGLTIDAIRRRCLARNAQSVRVVTLLYKSKAFRGEQPPEYVGFDIPNDFVVGYGMDYQELGRNLKGIYQVVDP